MLRVTKLTDYAIVVLTRLARAGEGAHSARDLAEASHIPVATVSKVLKELGRAGIVGSQRGVKGGYHLARSADEIRVTDVIGAMEGPVAITECCSSGPGCEQESSCEVSANWGVINRAIATALAGITLADMTTDMTRGDSPADPHLVSIHRELHPEAS